MPKIAETNWKLLKYREELFFRYFKWRFSVHDLDHSHYCRTLTREMNHSQRCWFSLLFGMTYRTPQAYAYWWTFKDFHLINMAELESWHADNWKRTTYGTDARYNKGHFVSQVQSIKNWVGKENLYHKIHALVSSDNPRENFQKLFDAICGLHKYGRMMSWITCQCLYDTLRLNIDFDNVLIRSPESDSSMKSVWNGYCILKGRPERLLGKQYGKGVIKLLKAEVDEAARDIMRYRDLACEYIGGTVDVFKWESVWCQFKRLFHDMESKEYPGHASGDAASRYPYYKEHWPEVDWTPFREALLTQPSMIRGQTFVREYNQVFGRTGLLLNMHEMYSDMPNAYERLGLDPNENLIEELFTDHGQEVPSL